MAAAAPTTAEVLAAINQYGPDSLYTAGTLAWRITLTRRAEANACHTVDELHDSRLRPLLRDMVEEGTLAAVAHNQRGDGDPLLRRVRAGHLKWGTTYYGLAAMVRDARADAALQQARVNRCTELLADVGDLLTEGDDPQGWFTDMRANGDGTLQLIMSPQRGERLFELLRKQSVQGEQDHELDSAATPHASAHG